MRMARIVRRCGLVLTLLFVMGLLVLGGCGGDSHSTGTVSGSVIDGYVANAQVAVYADMGMTQQLAVGTTDAQGHFTLDLGGNPLPSVFYLKAWGGIDQDTGLPAPTMRFVGSNNPQGIYVTPLTDMVFRHARVDGLAVARANLAGKLGISESQLYDNPQTGSLQQAAQAALQAGTMDTALPDGDYTLVLIYLENANINSDLYTDMAALLANNQLEGHLTVTNGQVSGTLAGEVVTGRVNGSGVALQVMDTPGNPTSFASLSGQVGLLGSFSGVYYSLDLSNPGNIVRNNGLFAAALVPQAGLQPAAVAQTVHDLYGQGLWTVFQDVFGSDHDTGYGTLDFTQLDPLTNQVALASNGLVVTFSSGVSSGNSDTVTLQQGGFVQTSSGQPTGLLVLQMLDSTGDRNYFILPLGSRRGIYLASDTDRSNSVDASAQYQAYAIGQAFLSADGLLVPVLKPTTDYQVAALNAPGFLVGYGFDPASSLSIPLGQFSITSPKVGERHVFDATDSLDIYTPPGMVATSVGRSFATLGNDAAMFEAYEGGALSGQIYWGGCAAANGVDRGNCDGTTYVRPLNQYPGLTLARMQEDGSRLPDFGAQRWRYLERPVSALNDDLSRLTSQRYGTLTVQSDGATAELQSDTGLVNLSVEQLTGGISHAYGTQNSERLDIYWIPGAPRGIYTRSIPYTGPLPMAAGSGNGGSLMVAEVGEVFLSD